MNQYRKYTRVISNLLLLLALVFFFLALFGKNNKNEAPIGEFSVWTFNENWSINGDVTQNNVTLPIYLSNDKSTAIVLKNVLPSYISDGMCLSMSTALQDARFYIDGVLRAEYVSDNFMLYGNPLPSAHVILELTDEDAGKPIEIELSMEKSIRLNEIKIGWGNNLWFELLSRNLSVTVAAIILICGGFLANLFFFTLGKRIHSSKAVLYLGQVMIVIGLWILSESHIRQLLFKNPSYSAIFAYILCELIGGYIALYFNEVQKHKYNTLYTIMEILIFGQALVNTLLNFTGLVRFYDTLIFSHVWLILCAGLSIATILLDIRSKHIRNYSITAWGMLLFMFFCGLELLDYYFRNYLILGKYICIALLVLLVATLAQTIHDEMQKLRQTATLIQEKEAAINASQAKSDFLARMSHEIRTPINSVLGIDEMILRESSEPQILDYAAKIKSSGQTLLYLINDILDLSKIESNKMEITPVEYEPRQLFSDVLLMIEPRANAKGLTLYCEIDPHIPAKLFGDDMRIRQILINLLTNAIKYTNEGKITFSVQLIQKAETEALLHFSVKDTGIGIKEEDRSLLFESFQRLDIIKNKEIEGTGLGLSISHRLLQLMGSDLCVQSVYGTGSDFNFQLKQNIADNSELGSFQKKITHSSSTTYQESFYAPTANILVTDDNNMNLLVFKGLLKNSGMNIHTALSGLEALELIQSNTYDLVFMDHMMPGMDGIEVLHHILKNEQLRLHAPSIIALTANAITGAKEFYLQEGFSGYLSKPIYGPDLEKTILEFLPADKFQLVAPKESPVLSPETTGIETNLLDQQLGLSFCAGSKEFYHEILKAFVQSNFQNTLQNYYSEEDWKNYRIIVHGIKSSAKSIGATPLSELAKDMEFALKERNDTGFIRSQHPVILQEIEKLEVLIQEIVQS